MAGSSKERYIQMDRRQFLRLMAGSAAYLVLPELAAPQGFPQIQSATRVATCPIVKVIGIGGAGVNIIEHLVNSEIHGISEYVCVDSNLETFQRSQRTTQIPLHSLKAGLSMPDGESQIQRAESYESALLSKVIDGTEIVFIVSGLGGRTGTMATELVARTAKKSGALTVALVVMPFSSESARPRLANKAVARIQPNVHLMVPFHLEQLRSLYFANKTCFPEILEYCNSRIAASIQLMESMFSNPEFSGVQGSHAKTFLNTAGLCNLGWGNASGSQPLWIAGAQSELNCVEIDAADRTLIAISTRRDRFRSTEFREYVSVRRENMAKMAGAIVFDYSDDSLAQGVTREIILASSSLPSSGAVTRFLQNLPD